jgi:heme/copper-type cytochrome/quinol oxidase subunit 4
MWFGIVIMVAMVVGIIWWMVWAMKKDKAKE